MWRADDDKVTAAAGRPSSGGLTTGDPELRLLVRPESGPFEMPAESSDGSAERAHGGQMKARAGPLVVGLGLAFFTGIAVAAPLPAIGGTEIFLGLLLLCWIGFPLLLLIALVWQLLRSLIASLRRPLPVIRAPDTDLMA